MAKFISRIKDSFVRKPEYPQVRLIAEHQKLKSSIRSCKTQEHFKIMYEFTHNWVDKTVLDGNYQHADHELSASLAINILQYLTIKEKELNS